jgi:hypothetical protein
MAQSPRASAIGPSMSASLGYSFISLAVPSSSRIGLNGLDAALTIGVIPRLAARIDVGYVRSSDVLNSGKTGDVLSYLAGPVFYPVRHRTRTVFVQGLLGGARVTGAVPVTGGGFLSGYVNRFAWAIGTGVEYRVSESIGFRIGADYLHTAYFQSATIITGQSDLRITGSLVYYFGSHRRKNH